MPIQTLDKEIIARSIRIYPDTSRPDRMSLTIRENDPDAKLRKVTLTGFDSPTVAFRLDRKKKRLSEFINKSSKKGINKGCDGVIITTFDGSRVTYSSASLNQKDSAATKNRCSHHRLLSDIWKRCWRTFSVSASVISKPDTFYSIKSVQTNIPQNQQRFRS